MSAKQDFMVANAKANCLLDVALAMLDEFGRDGRGLSQVGRVLDLLEMEFEKMIAVSRVEEFDAPVVDRLRDVMYDIRVMLVEAMSARAR